MIDPRFATAGAVPFAVGYGGARQMPFQQHYHHRHHHHHHNKSKNNVASDSPISRDESIHKVDYGRHNIQQSKLSIRLQNESYERISFDF